MLSQRRNQALQEATQSELQCKPPAGPGEGRPLASIGLPVYNGEKYLREAIDSVLAQTFANFEFIIADNASTDSTPAICREYAKKDARIRYFRHPCNIGAARNFNFTVEQARGTYFKWIAADSAIEPVFLERCIELLEREPTLVLALSRFRARCEMTGRSWLMDIPSYDLRADKPAHRFSKIIRRVATPIPVWGVMRLSVLRETHLIRPFIGSDSCFLAEMALRGPFGEIPGHHILIRRHADRYSNKKDANQGVEGRAEALWFDPQNRSRIFFPHWRRITEIGGYILRAREHVPGKLRMLLALGLQALRWRKIMLKELLFAGRDGVKLLRKDWRRK